MSSESKVRCRYER